MPPFKQSPSTAEIGQENQTNGSPELHQALSEEQSSQWDLTKAQTIGMAVKDHIIDDQKYYGWDAYALAGTNLDSINNDHEGARIFIAEVEEDFEKVYNLAPDLFSKMSVPQFKDIGREFRDLSINLNIYKTCLDRCNRIISKLQEDLADKYRRYSSRDLESFLIRNLSSYLTEDEYEEAAAKIISRRPAGFVFEHSPKQLLEQDIAIFTELADKFSSRLAVAEKELQAFITKYTTPDGLASTDVTK